MNTAQEQEQKTNQSTNQAKPVTVTSSPSIDRSAVKAKTT